ncbi:MAG: AMP-binding protein [Myxococcota bacterium]|nr:AMP-binding protein [Myxococcota bacterium]
MNEASDVLAALRQTLDRARQSPLYSGRLADLKVGSLEEFRAIPLTKREDLEKAGLHGTRALPLEEICHYGETSGTTGSSNSTWLTPSDFSRNARAIASRHPDIFAPGHILLNRFPFMAAPAHLIQLIAQQGGGVSIPAGNINWDVPFPRALDLAKRIQARVLAGFPFEPIILAQLAKARGLDPAKDFALETFFLGGSPRPRVLQKRIEKIWNARVVELYGSTETMLLGTACPERSLHLETGQAHCEILQVDSNENVAIGEVGRLIVTTLSIEGSPLIRFDTGDRVRRLGPCSCGDPRPGIIVLGREGEEVELGGRIFYSYEIIEAAASAADAMNSSVFFTVVLPDRLLVRIETTQSDTGAAYQALRDNLGETKVEIECTEPGLLLDTETLSRSPSVYKPVLISDWRGSKRQILSIDQGMIEWPSLGLSEALNWLKRTLRRTMRSRRLRKEIRVAKAP